MKVEKRVVIRYSEAFKHQVVKEVEDGHCTCAEDLKEMVLELNIGDHPSSFLVRRSIFGVQLEFQNIKQGTRRA